MRAFTASVEAYSILRREHLKRNSCEGLSGVAIEKEMDCLRLLIMYDYRGLFLFSSSFRARAKTFYSKHSSSGGFCDVKTNEWFCFEPSFIAGTQKENKSKTIFYRISFHVKKKCFYFTGGKTKEKQAPHVDLMSFCSNKSGRSFAT